MEFGGVGDPQDAGFDPDRLAEAIGLIEARGGVAQLCVVRDGRTVVDRSFGCSPNALFWLFSASKPYIAIVVHQLVESGRLHLDDAVAAYWPEFARNGKREITVREVLRHRSGLSNAGSYVGELRAMTDWDRAPDRGGQAALSDRDRRVQPTGVRVHPRRGRTTLQRDAVRRAGTS
jgi:CubicO group peptidase (beta-lactamase class C family)